MSDQATSSSVRPSEGSDRELAELREELARSREEILRLRDLLIGRDAELGTLRGRLTELEEGSARFITAAVRLRSRIPDLAQRAFRRLRSSGD